MGLKVPFLSQLSPSAWVTMKVLAKEGLKEALLGQDFPKLKQLLTKGITDFKPLTGILGPVEDTQATPDTPTMTLAGKGQRTGFMSGHQEKQTMDSGSKLVMCSSSSSCSSKSLSRCCSSSS